MHVRDVEDKEVIVAILQAEFKSSRFGEKVQRQLERLIFFPDLLDVAENIVREKLLNYRGFLQRKYLFQGFPEEVKWSLCILKDFSNLFYGNHEDWVELSQGTRSVTLSAKRLSDSPALRKEFPVVSQVLPGVLLQEHLPLVVCQHEGRLILVEGHARATAYAMCFPPDGVDMFLAEGNMNEWAWR